MTGERPLAIFLSKSGGLQESDFPIGVQVLLVPAEDDECEEYVILRVTEDGDDILLESIDDDDEFEKVEEYFNDLLFSEIDYDE